MSTTNTSYADFDVNLTLNPITKDISVKTNENSIAQAVRLLLNTSFYDRLWQPNVGSRLRDLLFSPLTDFNLMLAKTEIESIFKQYEPRIRINNIDISVANNIVYIKIDYTILLLKLNTSYTYSIEQLR